MTATSETFCHNVGELDLQPLPELTVEQAAIETNCDSCFRDRDCTHRKCPLRHSEDAAATIRLFCLICCDDPKSCKLDSCCFFAFRLLGNSTKPEVKRIIGAKSPDHKAKLAEGLRKARAKKKAA